MPDFCLCAGCVCGGAVMILSYVFERGLLGSANERKKAHIRCFAAGIGQ